MAKRGVKDTAVIKGIRPVTYRTSRGLPDHQLLWLQTGAAGSISDSPSDAHSPGSTLEGGHTQTQSISLIRGRDVVCTNTAKPQNKLTATHSSQQTVEVSVFLSRNKTQINPKHRHTFIFSDFSIHTLMKAK